MTVRVDPISLSCVACFVERAQVLICGTQSRVCPLPASRSRFLRIHCSAASSAVAKTPRCCRWPSTVILSSYGRDLPCFTAGRQTVEALRHRFQPQLGKRQCARFVDDLISNSLDHWTTTCYDRFQRCWLGIM